MFFYFYLFFYHFQKQNGPVNSDSWITHPLSLGPGPKSQWQYEFGHSALEALPKQNSARKESSAWDIVSPKFTQILEISRLMDGPYYQKTVSSLILTSIEGEHMLDYEDDSPADGIC